MGRLIGSFMDDNELDRPDLNKCPDCECYFPQDNCPICGKLCPEEMRAGNRKKVKAKKGRNGRSTQRVYVDWYHKWWFIAIMMFMFPIVGIILLATSPHNKVLKIAVIAIAVIYLVLPFTGIMDIGGLIKGYLDKPVDSSLSYEEYTAKCESIDIGLYYRNPGDHKDKFVKAELTVTKIIYDTMGEYEGSRYNDYYKCKGTGSDGKEYEIIIRECVVSGIENLAVGDVVTVYGECDGQIELYDSESDNYSKGACINAAYFELK